MTKPAATLRVDIDDVLPLIAERAPLGDETRRLDDDVVAAIAAAGANRALLPAELGGHEAHPGEVVDMVAAVAAADGSAGWCTAISTGSGIFAGYIAQDAARAMYADPDVGGAGMFAALGTVRTVDGKTTLTGRWPFASNCLHSRWIGLGAFVENEAGDVEPIPRLVVLPYEDVTIEDTWHGGGLRATGSHHVRVDGADIDLARSCTFGDTSWPDGPLWRMPLFTVLGPVLTAAPLGIARSAVDTVMERVPAGVAGMRGSLADDAVGLADLGVADAALRAARAGMLEALDEAWQTATAGQRASRPLQARVMLSVHHALDVAVETTSVAHRLSGGAAAYAGHSVLTALRDVETARQHIIYSRQNRPALARIASGIDEMALPFVT